MKKTIYTLFLATFIISLIGCSNPNQMESNIEVKEYQVKKVNPFQDLDFDFDFAYSIEEYGPSGIIYYNAYSKGQVTDFSKLNFIKSNNPPVNNNLEVISVQGRQIPVDELEEEIQNEIEESSNDFNVQSTEIENTTDNNSESNSDSNGDSDSGSGDSGGGDGGE